MHPALPIHYDFSLHRLNTFGIAANCHAYLPVTDIAMLEQVRCDPALASLPRLVLGGGSNIVLTQDYPGLVLHMANAGIELLDRTDQRIQIRAAAGVPWHDLVQWTLDHGIGGLENLSWIPGSVGASPIQNIGAYGVEAGDLIDSVRYFDFDSGKIVTLDRDQCGFGYRDSVFKNRLRDRAVILDVTFGLPVQWRPNLRYAELREVLETDLALKDAAFTRRSIEDCSAVEISAAVIAIRSRKLPDPALIGNVGSFFKNPVVTSVVRNRLVARWPGLVSFAQADGGFKLAAGWLIDQAGWKGRSIGAAGVYDKQALVLVNHGNATGTEVVNLARAIQTDIQARYGIMLEPEPLLV
ncbi:MAG: UDP-N-acetylmuramate dehydrogenase [Pseudomonadota bacterium]